MVEDELVDQGRCGHDSAYSWRYGARQIRAIRPARPVQQNDSGITSSRLFGECEVSKHAVAPRLQDLCSDPDRPGEDGVRSSLASRCTSNSARAFSTSWLRRSSSRRLRSCTLTTSSAVRALWKLLPPAGGVAAGSTGGGGNTGHDGGAGAINGTALAAVLRAGSLLVASRARTLSTSQPPPGSGAMWPDSVTFCSAVWETPRRRDGVPPLAAMAPGSAATTQSHALPGPVPARWRPYSFSM
jgi:hypothetical protein